MTLQRRFRAGGRKRIATVEANGGIEFVQTEKASTTLPGKVERVIDAHPASGEPEKAQIAVEGADHLYREIRVPNDLTDAQGQKVKLKVGAEVEVKIEANPIATEVALHDVPRKSNSSA